MTVDDFGAVEGRRAKIYTLTNSSGAFVKITNYGATVTELHVPDSSGALGDVVLGFDTVEQYLEKSQYFGCTAGRCANRIAKGRFTIDGQSYQLATNNGPNHLHGGVRGFDKVMWEATPADGNSLVLTYISPDGEEGYPGEVRAKTTYTWTEDNELIVEMEATTDAPTVVNLVHHSYWNLDGHDSGTILDHQLEIAAARYTPTDDTLIPTGVLAPVAGTPYDFTSPKPIGRDIADIPAGPDDPGGYDLNYAVDGEPDAMRFMARVVGPDSGRVMEIEADQPGIQFYSGNFIDGIPGKRGAVYPKNAALCLESQYYPDSINKQGRAGWPDVILRPGETYRHRMVHRFGVK
jgi:aldose 1-epimerase